MSNFRLWASNVNVDLLCQQLDAQPELWNRDKARTENADSPHHGVDDIYVRWRDPADPAYAEGGSTLHFAVPWPAWHALPALHSIVRDAAHLVDARHLGGILITRTPAGGQVAEHTDAGWHAGFYQRKLYLVLASNPLCLVHCDGDVENFRRGDLWAYPNNVPHSVQNGGATPHCNVIICFRTDEP